MKYYDPPLLVLCSFNMGKIQMLERHKNSKIHQIIFNSEPGTKAILRLLPVLHIWQTCQRISWTIFPGGSISTISLNEKKCSPQKKTMGPWARFWTHLTDLEHGLMGLKPQPLGIHFLSKAIEIATFFSLKIPPKEA